MPLAGRKVKLVTGMNTPAFPGTTGRESMLPTRAARGDWVRLRTLIALRWMAISGQAAAILVAAGVYGIQLNLGLSVLIVGASVVMNLIATFIFPANRRLSEAEAAVTFLIDSVQLAALIGVTGGLSNPFALLTLGPVTIAASTLQKRSTFLIGLATIAMTSVVAYAHLPLILADGTRLASPPLIEFGTWVAIVIGVVFLGLYAQRVSSEIHSMGDALLATQMVLAREQKLADIGGVVAAAAHELGTPLATIKLASAELADALADSPELREDAMLIRSQADRCRDILHSMGRIGKDDLYLRTAPLPAILREAAEPHLARGKTVHFADLGAAAVAGATGPVIERRPEVIHGLRNLIQNAVDFAHANVWIDCGRSDGAVTVRVSDDGPGYPPALIGRIGDPFVRTTRNADDDLDRPEYEGMGLGLFIAKTLLERTGAELTFANGTDPFLSEAERPERAGAIVVVRWPEAAIVSTAASPPAANPSN